MFENIKEERETSLLHLKVDNHFLVLLIGVRRTTSVFFYHVTSKVLQANIKFGSLTLIVSHFYTNKQLIFKDNYICKQSAFMQTHQLLNTRFIYII